MNAYIRHLIEKSGGDRQALATSAEVTTSYISQLINGNTGVSLDTAERFAKAFGMSLPLLVSRAYRWAASRAA